MLLRVKGKNVEVSDSIRGYAERKIAKLERQLVDGAEVEVELTVERNPANPASQVAEVTVWIRGHTHYRAREASPDMKASIDELTEKLMRQLAEERNKREARRKIDRRAANGDLAG